MKGFNQGSIEKNVRMIANTYPQFLLVENRKKAIIYYLENFEGVTFPLSAEDFFKVKSIESITRAIREVASEKGVKSKASFETEQKYHYYYSREHARL